LLVARPRGFRSLQALRGYLGQAFHVESSGSRKKVHRLAVLANTHIGISNRFEDRGLHLRWPGNFASIVSSVSPIAARSSSSLMVGLSFGSKPLPSCRTASACPVGSAWRSKSRSRKFLTASATCVCASAFFSLATACCFRSSANFRAPQPWPLICLCLPGLFSAYQSPSRADDASNNAINTTDPPKPVPCAVARISRADNQRSVGALQQALHQEIAGDQPPDRWRSHSAGSDLFPMFS